MVRIHIVNICVVRGGGKALLNKGSLKLLSRYYLAQFSRGGFDSTSGFVYSYSGCSVVRGKGRGPDSGNYTCLVIASGPVSEIL